jgi:hypothetical protein
MLLVFEGMFSQVKQGFFTVLRISYRWMSSLYILEVNVNLISFLFSVSSFMDFFFKFCFQAQLERFVPFMLQCSLGQKYLDRYTSTPKWWPTDLPFSVCVKKPVGMDDVSAFDTYCFHNQ